MATRTAQPAAETASDRLPFGLLLARLGQESVARFRKGLRPLDLTAQQFMVMKQLEQIGTASQADLAQALGLDTSNLATITGELNDAGLIERYRHENDRRRYVVELSDRGAKVLADASAEINELEEDLLGVLEPDDRERLWVLLRAVADGANLCVNTPDPGAASAKGVEVCDTEPY